MVALLSMEGNLGDLVPDWVSKGDPWLTEVRDNGDTTSWTMGDLVEQADALGQGLIEAGHAPGARIGILAANSARFLVAYFGIMRAGFCAVPINHKLPAASIAHIVSDAELVLTLCDGPRAALLPEGHPAVRLDLDGAWYSLLADGPAPLVTPAAGDFANILYTSGTTGKPKGVPLTHGGYRYALRAALRFVDLPWVARGLVAAPLYHMNGLFFSKMLLAGGAHEVLMTSFDAGRFLRAASDHRCTYLSGIPTMMAMALRETDLTRSLDFSAVTAITIGSAPVTEDLLKQTAKIFPNAKFANSYGTTESGPTAFMPHPDGRPTPWPAMGVASDMVELKLVGGSKNEGTLWVRSPVVMPGYLNLPEKSAERLEDGWYNTGDVMRRDAAGFYYFVDRADDMFVCGGENVHPGDVEAMLLGHEDVDEVCVVPVADSIKGQLSAAFIVPRPGSTPDAEAIRAYALEHGPAYQHPRFIEFVEALPWQGTNKVDRKALRTRAAAFSRDAESSDTNQRQSG